MKTLKAIFSYWKYRGAIVIPFSVRMLKDMVKEFKNPDGKTPLACLVRNTNDPNILCFQFGHTEESETPKGEHVRAFKLDEVHIPEGKRSTTTVFIKDIYTIGEKKLFDNAKPL